MLAIGATGFIGRPAVERLVEGGCEVAVLHRGGDAAEPPRATALPRLPEGAREIRGDRNRIEDLRASIDRFSPDVVLDLILYTEKQARELFAAVTDRSALASRLVAVSSADVYRNYDGLRGRATAPPDAVPLAEDAPLRDTRYPYRGQDHAFEHAHDYDKILVERALQPRPGSDPHSGVASVPVTVLRLPAVYGPGDRQHRLRHPLGLMQPGRAEILLGEAQARWRWTRGYVENVAAAVALAVTDPRSAGRVYNVGDEPALTEREWMEQIALAAGWSGNVTAVPDADLPDHLGQPLDWRYELSTDTTRIRRELGYAEPVPLAEALRASVAWERAALETTKR